MCGGLKSYLRDQGGAGGVFGGFKWCLRDQGGAGGVFGGFINPRKVFQLVIDSSVVTIAGVLMTIYLNL